MQVFFTNLVTAHNHNFVKKIIPIWKLYQNSNFIYSLLGYIIFSKNNFLYKSTVKQKEKKERKMKKEEKNSAEIVKVNKNSKGLNGTKKFSQFLLSPFLLWWKNAVFERKLNFCWIVFEEFRTNFNEVS